MFFGFFSRKHQVWLLGSLPELGEWFPSRAIETGQVEGEWKVWQAGVRMPMNTTFQWSWCTLAADGRLKQWEASQKRERRINFFSGMLHTAWGDPLVEIFRQNMGSAYLITERRTKKGDVVAVVGSSPSLGAWDPSKAVMASEFPPRSGHWAVTVYYDSGAMLEWNWIIIDKETKQVKLREKIKTRFLFESHNWIKLNAPWNKGAQSVDWTAMEQSGDGEPQLGTVDLLNLRRARNHEIRRWEERAEVWRTTGGIRHTTATLQLETPVPMRMSASPDVFESPSMPFDWLDNTKADDSRDVDATPSLKPLLPSVADDWKPILRVKPYPEVTPPPASDHVSSKPIQSSFFPSSTPAATPAPNVATAVKQQTAGGPPSKPPVASQSKSAGGCQTPPKTSRQVPPSQMKQQVFPSQQTPPTSAKPLAPPQKPAVPPQQEVQAQKQPMSPQKPAMPQQPAPSPQPSPQKPAVPQQPEVLAQKPPLSPQKPAVPQQPKPAVPQQPEVLAQKPPPSPQPSPQKPAVPQQPEVQAQKPPPSSQKPAQKPSPSSQPSPGPDQKTPPPTPVSGGARQGSAESKHHHRSVSRADKHDASVSTPYRRPDVAVFDGVRQVVVCASFRESSKSAAEELQASVQAGRKAASDALKGPTSTPSLRLQAPDPPNPCQRGAPSAKAAQCMMWGSVYDLGVGVYDLWSQCMIRDSLGAVPGPVDMTKVGYTHDPECPGKGKGDRRNLVSEPGRPGYSQNAPDSMLADDPNSSIPLMDHERDSYAPTPVRARPSDEMPASSAFSSPPVRGAPITQDGKRKWGAGSNTSIGSQVGILGSMSNKPSLEDLQAFSQQRESARSNDRKREIRDREERNRNKFEMSKQQEMAETVHHATKTVKKTDSAKQDQSTATGGHKI
ncbi:hypothetical protein ACOMHN_029038 [Nucella lapillus]